jgi:predicted amidohydrolase YtcJ
LQTAVTRKTSEGQPEGRFLPGEAVSLEQGIEAYTLGAAFAARRENQEGSLVAGKLADLIIVDQDLFHIPASQIEKTQVLLTMVGGKIVYESAEWRAKSTAEEK